MQRKIITLIIWLSILNCNYLKGQVDLDFNSCPANSNCNAFYPFATCSGFTLKTIYGSPSYYNYSYIFDGLPTTKQAVRLEGNRVYNNNVTSNVDEGFEIPFVFKPNTRYAIRVLASGISVNGTNHKISTFEIILAGQSLQQNNNCDLSIFDGLANNGLAVAQFTPTNYAIGNSGVGTFDVRFLVPTANYSRIIIRSKTTSTDIGDYNNVLIYRIWVTEGQGDGSDNTCHDTNLYINFDVNLDYNNPPPGGISYGTRPSAYYNLYANKSLVIANGSYEYVSNRDIFFQPGYHVTPGNGGVMRAVIGQCRTLQPLRETPKEQVLFVQTEEEVKDDKYSIYPIPSSGVLKISTGSLEIQNRLIHVFDQLGKEVYRTRIQSNNKVIELNLQHLSNGIYYLKISSLNKSIIKKVIINK